MHISFLLMEKNGNVGDHRSSQGFVKGNVAILPQDTLTLQTVIPPDHDEIHNAMCALLIGHEVQPSRENSVKLGPILVNKTVVCTLANFLVTDNKWYHDVVTVDEKTSSVFLRVLMNEGSQVQ